MPGEPRSLPERRTDRWTIELIPNCPETTAPETPTPNHRFFKFFLCPEEPAGNHQLAQPTLAEPKLTPTETRPTEKPADGNKTSRRKLSRPKFGSPKLGSPGNGPVRIPPRLGGSLASRPSRTERQCKSGPPSCQLPPPARPRRRPRARDTRSRRPVANNAFGGWHAYPNRSAQSIDSCGNAAPRRRRGVAPSGLSSQDWR